MNYNAPEGGRLRDALYRLDYKAFKGVDGKGNTVEYRDDPQKGWRRKVNGEDSPTDGSPWIDAMYALSKAFKNGSLEKESATNAPDEKARNPAESWETRPLDTLADVVKFIDDESGWWNPAKPAAQRLLEAVKRLGYTSFKGVDGEGSNVEFRQQDDGLWNRTLNGLDTGEEKGYWTSAMYTLSNAFKNGSLTSIDAPDKPAAPGTTVNEMEAEAKAVQQEEQQNADPQWEADKAYCERVINGELSQMGEVSAVIDQIMDIWDRADASGIAERSQLVEQAYNLIEKTALEAGKAAIK